MGKDALTRQTGMSLEEAYKILNLKKNNFDASTFSKVFNYLTFCIGCIGCKKKLFYKLLKFFMLQSRILSIYLK